MRIPGEFVHLGECFMPDVASEVGYDAVRFVDTGVSVFLNRMPEADRGKTAELLIGWIDEVLKSNLLELEMHKLWYQADIAVAIMPDSKMSNLFALIRARLARSLPPKG
jgi:hypothetical protein